MSNQNQDNSVEEIINENNKFNPVVWIIVSVAGILILFSFFAPLLFTLKWIDFTGTGQIGDTIGGIMNPFIALAGVGLTFLAFYMQYSANRNQLKQFKIQQNADRIRFQQQQQEAKDKADTDKRTFEEELRNQQQQFRRTQFENQFFTMLSLHKENVNEITIYDMFGKKVINGRPAFPHLLNELELYFVIAKYRWADQTSVSIQDCVNEAYGILFMGLNQEREDKDEYFTTLRKIENSRWNENINRSLQSIVEEHTSNKVDFKKKITQSLLKGYSTVLAHYYRHLFQTVKFVVRQSEDLLSYEDKRNYLRILRSQLSNEEQAMLFYNWLSKFGKPWQDETNKFFTDFRMIHNIFPKLLLPGVNLEEFFPADRVYRKEKKRTKDPLFEYQDWE